MVAVAAVAVAVAVVFLRLRRCRRLLLRLLVLRRCHQLHPRLPDQVLLAARGHVCRWAA